MAYTETYWLILNFFLLGHRRMFMVRWVVKMQSKLAVQQQKTQWERKTSVTDGLTKTEKYIHKDQKSKVNFLHGFLSMCISILNKKNNTLKIIEREKWTFQIFL